MIYLTTGANGTGKTLLTLKAVREKQLLESRPVYHNGRFTLSPEGKAFGWQEIDFKDWQSVPDGAIFIIDECHNDMPVRTGRDSPPEPIRMLAEHRRRGFDFYLITQHPMNIDSFVRRLIGSPGWHKNLKRQSGAPLVSCTEWNVVNEQPQKPSASQAGQLSMVAYPKEVYGWYESAVLHTSKTKIPLQVKVFLGLLFLIPFVAWMGWRSFADKMIPTAEQVKITQADSAKGLVPQAAPVKSLPVLTSAEYIQAFEPRLAGLPHTAPRYDQTNVPSQAPYPAACVKMGDRCQCYSQQATKLDIPLSICLDIVEKGFFMDWLPNSNSVTRADAVTTPLKDNGAT